MRLFSLIVLGSLVLGACSTSNDVVGGGIFQKRKYTGGVYWDRSEKLKTAKEKEDEEFDIFRVEEESQRKYVSNTTIRTDETVQYSKSEMDLATVNESEDFLVSRTSNATATVTESVEDNSTATQQSSRKSKIQKLKDKQPAGGANSDVMLILLIILAIIIPPLAVFIYEGASTRFIIDLILAILGWGAFGIFGGIFWLCGLAAIIYALLIVLGAI